ncbi:HNH endonuclease-domain-containing protein [Durotheca rogersii]|uniref:HNH endonuclease-domain-containing protein n=1 Tax=Durotheca rogersii TaxID=419775 RepID=UPI002220BA17|nr:HNH endonuclease-domain-containing protein [Durotheca rogersii]KAI5864459.1 HNH endonuclease-domain-containing protein [Durotheca rogersii]
MSRNRRGLLLRDVNIWDLSDSEDRIPLGGLRRTPGITNKDFRHMLDILLVTSVDFVVQNEHGDEILQNDEPLLPGDYTVMADKVEVNNEIAYTRVASITTGSQVQAFRDAVRARDNRCVISKVVNVDAEVDDWTSFEAAHIFPLAYESQWNMNNYGRWITIDPPQGGEINSVQNGLLLRSHLHQEWDQYRFSINPDNGHKIIFFGADLDQVAGSTLDRQLLDDPCRPPDSLFRWHFRQAVLSNIRGAAEPIFEHDFPPGSDIMGEILAGPKAGQRMEFELFDRLAHHVKIV